MGNTNLYKQAWEGAFFRLVELPDRCSDTSDNSHKGKPHTPRKFRGLQACRPRRFRTTYRLWTRVPCVFGKGWDKGRSPFIGRGEGQPGKRYQKGYGILGRLREGRSCQRVKVTRRS